MANQHTDFVVMDFRRCECGYILDVFRYDRGEQTCACPRELAVSVNPLPAHMQAEIEPYIRWRESQAIAQFVLQVHDSRQFSSAGFP